jgi:hypothetical protein
VDEAVIMQRIMQSGDLARCFGDTSVQLTLDINTTGCIDSAAATASSGNMNAEAEACFQAAAPSWRFHHPAHALKVTYTRAF